MLKFATCQQFNDELSIMNANKQQNIQNMYYKENEKLKGEKIILVADLKARKKKNSDK